MFHASPLTVLDVRFQDSAEAGTSGCSTARADFVEDLLDLFGGSDIHVRVRVWGVEEMDVDAVTVVLGANWSDGFEGVPGFVPFGAGHGAGVVDEEDGVEGAEEGVRVVSAWSNSCGGGGVGGGWF